MANWVLDNDSSMESILEYLMYSYQEDKEKQTMIVMAIEVKARLGFRCQLEYIQIDEVANL